MEENLREDLVRSLEEIYQLPAFGALADLLQGEALVLQYLEGHRDGPVCPSVLSGQLHLSRSRITGALASLHRKELVRMEPSADDRRRTEVFITPAGSRRIAEQISRMLAYFDRMIAGLGPEDTRRLIALMDRCVGIMGE